MLHNSLERIMSAPILHYTLNTGREVDQPRFPLSKRTIRLLKPLVLDGGGQLPGILASFSFRMSILPDLGSCEYSLFCGRDRIVRSVLCWQETAFEPSWMRVERAYFAVLLASSIAGDPKSELAQNLCQHAPRRPGRLPWLARVIEPGYSLHQDQNLVWVGDFERCLAWTVLLVCRPKEVKRRRARRRRSKSKALS
jgi:hypothetical protein